MYFLCCSVYFCVVLCIVCFVSFPVLFVFICVLLYCHRVATQLQLNISYHIVQRTCLQCAFLDVSGRRYEIGTPLIITVFASAQDKIQFIIPSSIKLH